MLFLYKEPLLYVSQLQPESIYTEEESTSIFETTSKPSPIEKQLQFLARQQRYVTIVLLTGERVYGKVIRLEQEKVLIHSKLAKIWVEMNAIRAVK